jgi:hypothetical protein
MRKLAIRLLTLTIYCAPLIMIPVVSPANAATNGNKHMKKHAKVQRAPVVQSGKSPNPFPPMNEDPDRKAAGGGY